MTSKRMDDALSAIFKLDSEEELLKINRTLVDRLKTIRARESYIIKSSLNEGDEVTWVGRKGSQRGSVIKIMRKYASIKTAQGTWRVPMNMLKKTSQ
jgi:hypothetical protein